MLLEIINNSFEDIVDLRYLPLIYACDNGRHARLIPLSDYIKDECLDIDEILEGINTKLPKCIYSIEDSLKFINFIKEVVYIYNNNLGRYILQIKIALEDEIRGYYIGPDCIGLEDLERFYKFAESIYSLGVDYYTITKL